MSEGKEFEGKTDEELLLRLRGGDSSVMDYIMEKYKGLVLKKAHPFFLPGADREDLVQEGMIGLFKAVRDYDPGRDAGFFTFAELCISRQIYTAVHASVRKKHAPLNTYVPLEATEEGLDGEAPNGQKLTQPGRKLTDSWQSDPEELLLAREKLESLEKIIDQKLSPFEKQVLVLHRAGMGYRQIAQALGRDARSADNALQRSRRKIRAALGEDGKDP